MKEDKFPVVILAGSDVVTLGLARSLGLKNIPVILVRSKKSIASYSKFVTKTILCPDRIKHEKEFISSLISYGEDMIQQYGRRLLLLPTVDPEILVISKYYGTLKKYFVILGDPTEKEGLHKFIRKDLFFEEVKKVNIPMPITLPCLNEHDIDYVVDNMTYPCIIKPAIKDVSFSFFNYYHAKTIECDSSSSLCSTLQDVIHGGHEVIVQEKIPGCIEDSLDLCSDRNGKVIAAFVARKLGQSTPASGSYVTLMLGRWNAEIFEYGKLLLKQLNFWGISQIEFKRDSRDGEYKVIEMNVRPWLSIYIATAGGINIPYIAYQNVYEQIWQEATLTPLPIKEGIKWINLSNPLALLKNDKKYGNRLEILSSLLHSKKKYAFFSLNDSLPCIINIFYLTKAIAGSVKDNLIKYLIKLDVK